MADAKIEFELVAPEKLLVSKAVEMVVVPGTEGDFGVLVGHAPLISSLRNGVIEIHDGGVVTDRIFVGIMVIGLLGLLTDQAFKYLHRWLLPWSPKAG